MKTWTDEDDQEVLALHASGLTRLQIAKQMGVTRNAICGKLFRLLKRGDEPVTDYIGEYLVDYSLLTPDELAKPFEGEAELWAKSKTVAAPVDLRALRDPNFKNPIHCLASMYKVGDRVRLTEYWVGLHPGAAWHEYWSGRAIVTGCADGIYLQLLLDRNGGERGTIGPWFAHKIEHDTSSEPKAGDAG